MEQREKEDLETYSVNFVVVKDGRESRHLVEVEISGKGMHEEAATVVLKSYPYSKIISVKQV